MSLSLPFIVRTDVIVGVFLSEIVLMHIVLVFLPWFRLNARQWKKVQYITLALASLGILGAVSSARQVVAHNLVNLTALQSEVDFHLVRIFVNDHTNGPAICRTFVRSEYSPSAEEFAKTQSEFDQACQWFKQLSAALPQDSPTSDAQIDWNSLPAPPSFTEPQLTGDVREFKHLLNDYNKKTNVRRELQAAAHQSDPEEFLLAVTPLIISFALALQITKVTGDLKTSP
jgi:hypothetical protein